MTATDTTMSGRGWSFVVRAGCRFFIRSSGVVVRSSLQVQKSSFGYPSMRLPRLVFERVPVPPVVPILCHRSERQNCQSVRCPPGWGPVRYVSSPLGLTTLILGGAHDFSDNIDRISCGTCEYMKITTGWYRESLEAARRPAQRKMTVMGRSRAADRPSRGSSAVGLRPRRRGPTYGLWRSGLRPARARGADRTPPRMRARTTAGRTPAVWFSFHGSRFGFGFGEDGTRPVAGWARAGNAAAVRTARTIRGRIMGDSLQPGLRARVAGKRLAHCLTIGWIDLCSRSTSAYWSAAAASSTVRRPSSSVTTTSTALFLPRPKWASIGPPLL